MFGKKFLAVLGMATLVAAVSFAQPAGGGGAGGAGGRMTPEERAKMMADQMKKALNVNDEEWAKLAPAIEKVRTIQNQSRIGMMGGRGGRGGAPGATAPAATSDVQVKAEDLRKVLQDTNSTVDDVKAKLAAYRAAREKAKVELTTAQDELRKMLNPRQEAQLVVDGLLE